MIARVGFILLAMTAGLYAWARDCGFTLKTPIDQAVTAELTAKADVRRVLRTIESAVARDDTGEATAAFTDVLPRVREFARRMGPATLKLDPKDGMVVWDWGYRGVFLCEYFLLTGDREVLHAIGEYTVSLAKGQSLYGTFGHGVSMRTPDGQLHGCSLPALDAADDADLAGAHAAATTGIKEPVDELRATIDASDEATTPKALCDQQGIPPGQGETDPDL